MKLDENIEPQRSGIRKSKSTRARMIFSVMASPNRIEILRILNSQGLLTYSELKSLAGFKSKKESGKFAYHLRKLLSQSLVKLNRFERKYFINNTGKLVLSLARQIEERSIVEGGKSYVRTSHNSKEEFDPHKILQSLVHEGNLPQELAQKMTEETENKIYKYQIINLTSSLIREIVNSVLLEHGYEEYRSKMSRLGIPPFDIQKMLVNIGDKDGLTSLLNTTSDQIFTEYLFSNVFSKDIIDSHLSGDIHIEQTGIGSLLPDILFLSIKELVEDGLNLHGKMLSIPRMSAPDTLSDICNILTIIIPLISREVSQEIILNDFISLLSDYSTDSKLEKHLVDVFTTTSSTIHGSTTIYLQIPLNSDSKLVSKILNAYYTFAKITPKPTIGLAINYEKAKIADTSKIIAKIVSISGLIYFTKKTASSGGIVHMPKKTNLTTAIKLYPFSINLPRLALDSNSDYSYFKTTLAMAIKPTIAAMVLRKKEIVDFTHRGLNPILAKNTQSLQRVSISMVVNLVGFQEAIFDILKQTSDIKISTDMINSLINVVNTSAKEFEENISISLSTTNDPLRFVSVDVQKFGKSAVSDYIDTGYSQGINFDASAIDKYTTSTKQVVLCNHLFNTLNGGVRIQLHIAQNANITLIQQSIEKMTTLTDFFVPIKKTPICGNCGLKDSKLVDKCSACNSHFII
ncbi:MAG: anaerobic ribonucleoside-triphosphate reductase [Candidatus Nitrosoabyssus spongiisocia]|nr:MAG: anaerobic ribonucleoside-triphosphate reductase [Nitrosopumilaceae archaeon AB1(1)]